MMFSTRWAKSTHTDLSKICGADVAGLKRGTFEKDKTRFPARSWAFLEGLSETEPEMAVVRAQENEENGGEGTSGVREA